MEAEFNSGPSITRLVLSEELSQAWEAERDPRFGQTVSRSFSAAALEIIAVARRLSAGCGDLVRIENSEGVELLLVGES